MTLLLGTSGWSYDDWVGPFYPLRMEEEKGAWLSHYAGHFATVEVASSSFRVPEPELVESWIRKTNVFPEFELSFVLPHEISHYLLKRGDFESIYARLDDFEEAVMAPLYKMNRLGVLVFELSPGYKFNERNYASLRKVVRHFKFRSYDYSVEFQHRSWLNYRHDALRDEVYHYLRDRNIAPCMVDGPSFPFIPENYCEHACLRLYGRNREAWAKARLQRVSSGKLFDYDYSHEELKGIASKLQRHRGRKLRVYFKNHTRGHAISNLVELALLTGVLQEENGEETEDETERTGEKAPEDIHQKRLDHLLRQRQGQQTSFEDF